jgi:hypothetical protein
MALVTRVKSVGLRGLVDQPKRSRGDRIANPDICGSIQLADWLIERHSFCALMAPALLARVRQQRGSSLKHSKPKTNHKRMHCD